MKKLLKNFSFQVERKNFLIRVREPTHSFSSIDMTDSWETLEPVYEKAYWIRWFQLESQFYHLLNQYYLRSRARIEQDRSGFVKDI